MRAKFPLAALAIVLAATACGGGSSSPSSRAKATDTTAKPAVNPADQALANQAVLTLSDLPPGWTSNPHENTDSKKSDEKLAQCLHLPSSKLIGDAANADSADFTSPTGQQVTNSVGVAKTPNDVREVLDVMSRSDAADCFAEIFDAAIREQSTTGTAPADTTFGKTTVSPESFESLGDRTVAYRVTVPVTTKGVNVSIYIDFIVVQKGRVGITLTALDTLTPVPADASASLLGKVLSRIPAAT